MIETMMIRALKGILNAAGEVVVPIKQPAASAALEPDDPIDAGLTARDWALSRPVSSTALTL